MISIIINSYNNDLFITSFFQTVKDSTIVEILRKRVIINNILVDFLITIYILKNNLFIYINYYNKYKYIIKAILNYEKLNLFKLTQERKLL